MGLGHTSTAAYYKVNKHYIYTSVEQHYAQLYGKDVSQWASPLTSGEWPMHAKC